MKYEKHVALLRELEQRPADVPFGGRSQRSHGPVYLTAALLALAYGVLLFFVIRFRGH